MKNNRNLSLLVLLFSIFLVSFVSASLNISIISPLENNTYGKSFQLLNVYLNEDEGISTCLYSVNYSANVTLSSNGSYWVETNLSLSEGEQIIEVYCNDTSNVWFYANVTFTHDQTPPVLIIYSPVDGAITNDSTVLLNVSSPDPDVNQLNWKYLLNNGSFIQFEQVVNVTLENGTNQLVVGLADKYGNWNSTTLYLTYNPIFSEEPEVNDSDENETVINETVNVAPIAMPDQYEVMLNGSITADVSLNDSEVNLTVFLVQDVLNGTLTLLSNGTFQYVAQENFSGIVFFSYFASDGEFNSSVVNVTLYVNQSFPVVLPVIDLNSGSSRSSGGGGSGGYCSTKWECTDWSSCDNGTQTRTCSYRSTFCAPVALKPLESQSCVITLPTENQNNTSGNNSILQNFNSLLTGAVIGSGAKVFWPVLILLIILGLVYWFVAAKKQKGSEVKASKKK